MGVKSGQLECLNACTQWTYMHAQKVALASYQEIKLYKTIDLIYIVMQLHVMHACIAFCLAL